MRPNTWFNVLRSTLSVVIGTALSIAPWAEQGAAQDRWSVYADQKGTRIPYPAHIFSVDRGHGENGTGQVLTTGDGRARIHMFSLPNTQGDSPSEYLRKYFPVNRAALTYDRVTRNFFAISSRRDGMIIYMRCNFSTSAGGTLHCVDLRYPIREKLAWDGIVTRISLSVRPL